LDEVLYAGPSDQGGPTLIAALDACANFGGVGQGSGCCRAMRSAVGPSAVRWRV